MAPPAPVHRVTRLPVPNSSRRRATNSRDSLEEGALVCEGRRGWRWGWRPRFRGEFQSLLLSWDAGRQVCPLQGRRGRILSYLPREKVCPCWQLQISQWDSPVPAHETAQSLLITLSETHCPAIQWFNVPPASRKSVITSHLRRGSTNSIFNKGPQRKR